MLEEEIKETETKVEAPKEEVSPKTEDVAVESAPKIETPKAPMEAPKEAPAKEATPKEEIQGEAKPHSDHPHGDHPHGEHAQGEHAQGERKPRGDAHHKGGQRPDRKRVEEPKEFEERTVYINRVAKTVKGGRRMKFTALVVIGNHKGKYGFGLGKAAEVPDAIKKATEIAKKNIYTIPLVKGGTIPHEVMGHYGASKVYLKPAPEGTGIVAGGAVRAVLELAGVTNVCSKVYGSKNSVNVVKACNDGTEHLTSYKQVQKLRVHTISTTPSSEEEKVESEPKEVKTSKPASKSTPKPSLEGGK